MTSSGYATLISVLFVSVIGTSIVVSLLLFGINSSRASLTVWQSSQANSSAAACAEEALAQIRSSSSFTGSGGLTFGEQSCSYLVTSQGGQNRTLTASSTVDAHVRKVKIIINAINPRIQVTSWQEVADF